MSSVLEQMFGIVASEFGAQQALAQQVIDETISTAATSSEQPFPSSKVLLRYFFSIADSRGLPMPPRLDFLRRRNETSREIHEGYARLVKLKDASGIDVLEQQLQTVLRSGQGGGLSLKEEGTYAYMLGTVKHKKGDDGAARQMWEWGIKRLEGCEKGSVEGTIRGWMKRVLKKMNKKEMNAMGDELAHLSLDLSSDSLFDTPGFDGSTDVNMGT